MKQVLRASKKAQGESMGTFKFVFEVASADRSDFRSVEALVDTGAHFSRLPGALLRELGYTATGNESFELGDGSVVDWDITDVWARIDERVRYTTCIFGPDDATPVLGAVTLEQFLLMVDPNRQEIIPTRGMFMAHGKKYIAATEKVEPMKEYEPKDAVALLKEIAYAKFDETAELHIRTGLDTRHADQQLRGTLVLPHGLGKGQRVVVFAEGEAARIASENGADEVGGDDLVKKVEGGFTDFEIALATKEMMGKVGRLGRVLGPRGLMPNPRTNTVVDANDLPKAIKDAKQGRVEFRTDRTNLVHVPFGKISFDKDALLENLTALIEAIMREKPTGAKGQYIRTMTITTTMSPGIKLDVQATTGAFAGVQN